MENNEYGQLPYSQLWCLELINDISGMVDVESAFGLAEKSHRDVAFRSTALTVKSAGYIDWVRGHKENWSTFGPWDRRALIFAAQILPSDERNPWLGVVGERGDSLDAAIAEFVRATAPIRKSAKKVTKKSATPKTAKKKGGGR